MGKSLRLFLWNKFSLEDTVLGSSGTLDEDLHPLLFVKNLAVSDTWKSSGIAGDTYITADLTAASLIGGVGIIAKNLTRAARVRVRVGNTANFSTNLYDSGSVAFHLPVYTTAEREATSLYPDNCIGEFFDTSGLPTTQTIDSILKRPVRTFEFPAEISARYLRIDFFDSTNPDGYVEIAHVYMGRVLEPSPDILYGYRVGRSDTARLPQSASGQYWCAKVYRRTRMSFTFAPQRESDMLGYWYLMEMIVGLNSPFILTIEDSTDSIKFHTSMFGMLMQSPQNTNIAFKRHSFSFDCEEVIGVNA